MFCCVLMNTHKRLSALRKIELKINVYDDKKLKKKLSMHALPLAVRQRE